MALHALDEPGASLDAAVAGVSSSRWPSLARDGVGVEPWEVVADLRDHIHSPYLHRRSLPPGLRDADGELMAVGRLPATGALFTRVRHD